RSIRSMRRASRRSWLPRSRSAGTGGWCSFFFCSPLPGGAPPVVIALPSAGSGLAWHLAPRVTGRPDAAWFGWAAVTASVTGIFHSFSIYPDGPGGAIVLTGVWALVRAEEEAASGADAMRPWFLHG